MDAPVGLAELVRSRVDEVVEEMMERQWNEVPEFWVTDDSAFHTAVRQSTRENTDVLVDLIEHPGPLPRGLCAGSVLEADVTAQHGASSAALVRTYYLCGHALTEHLLDLVDETNPLAGIAAARRATRVVHRYLHTMAPLAASEHAAERARIQLHPDLRRLRMVQAALAGDPASGIALDGVHVAVVSAAERAELVVAAVAAALGLDHLSVRAEDGRCWSWLHGAADADEVGERLRRAGLGTTAGVGGPGPFRTAHEHAALAERIGRSRGAGVVDLRGVTLEALALGDQRTALAVARAELRPLVDRPPALRDTLVAWFAQQESLGDTARALGVAPRTVSYRLRRVESLLGHPIAARRAELEAALRVERLLDAPR